MFSLHPFISELAFCIREDIFLSQWTFFYQEKEEQKQGQMPEVLQVVQPSRSAFFHSPLPLDYWCLVVGH